MTQRRICKERLLNVSSSSLQIARQAGPNYNNHTDRATHRPTWLEGASQSYLIYVASQELYVALLPNNLSLQPAATIFPLAGGFPGRVSSPPLIVPYMREQPCIRMRASLNALIVILWFSTCESVRGWRLLFYLWPLQGPEKGRFSQSHPLITPSPANHQASSSTFLQNEGVPPRFTLNPKVWPLPTHSGLTLFPTSLNKPWTHNHTCAQTHTYQKDTVRDRPNLQ